MLILVLCTELLDCIVQKCCEFRNIDEVAKALEDINIELKYDDGVQHIYLR